MRLTYFFYIYGDVVFGQQGEILARAARAFADRGSRLGTCRRA